jgi:hypothetical protein
MGVKCFFCLLIISFCLSSCSKLPAGFWENFDSDNLKINKCNQGPRGGYRAMYWKKSKGFYNEKTLLNFATSNGWKLKRITAVKLPIVQSWKNYDNHLVFPLSHDGLDLQLRSENKDYGLFPRWINYACRLYEFQTNWVVISNDDSHTSLGYILLDDDNTQLSMYHLWGE